MDKSIRQSQSRQTEENLKRPEENLSELIAEGAFTALSPWVARYGTTWTTMIEAGHLFAKPDIPLNGPPLIWDAGRWQALFPYRHFSLVLRWGDEVWWDVDKQAPVVIRGGTTH